MILDNFIKDLESLAKKSTTEAFNDILDILKNQCPEVATKVSEKNQMKNIFNHQEFLAYFIKYIRQCYSNFNHSIMETEIKLLISNIYERFKRTVFDQCIGCKEKMQRLWCKKHQICES